MIIEVKDLIRRLGLETFSLRYVRMLMKIEEVFKADGLIPVSSICNSTDATLVCQYLLMITIIMSY